MDAKRNLARLSNGMRRLKRCWTALTPALCIAGLSVSTPSQAAQPCLIYWTSKDPVYAFGTWSWFNENVMKHVVVSGNTTLGLHLDKVTGDTTSYDVTTNYGQGSRVFTDNGNVNIQGSKVLGVFNFDFQFDDNHFQDPLASHLSLNYNKDGLRIDAGDINVSMPTGNRFTSFTRQLYGVFGSWHTGKWTMSLLDSASKSTAQTISFAGNNSVGPYYLQNTQILPDIAVQVDGKSYQLGVDFDLDPVQGAITFKTLVVPPTSTITVSYESVGLNSGGGELQAAALGYDFGPFGSVTYSTARQTQPGGSGLANFTEYFQGYGDPSLPYQLEYVPLSEATVVVRVDGITQVLGTDFYFSTTNPTFIFFYRAIPPTSTITVTYNPQPTNNLQGDRTVTGLSYSLPIGPKGRDGNFNYSEATGSLSNGATPLHGVAQGIDASYKFKSYKITVSADDVPNGFVGINTTGFQRNEVAQTVTIEDKIKRFGYGITESNSAVGNQSTTSTGGITFTNSRSTLLGGYLNYGEAADELWNLQQSHLAGYSSSGVTRADQTSLSYSKQFGNIEPKLILSHTEGLGPITDSSGNTNQGHINLNSIGLNASFQAGKNWVLSGQTTFDQIKTDSSSGSGEDIDFSAAYRGLKKVVWTARYTYSNSGSLASLGQFQNGTGTGYNGNGFSSGLGSNLSTDSFNTSATDLRRLSTNVLWTPNDRLSTNLSLSSTGQSGDITTNSNNTSAQISTDFHVTKRSNIDASVTTYSTNFQEVGVPNTGSTIYSVSFDDSPKGPWSYRISVSDLVTTGGSEAQDSYNFNFSIRHRLHKNQTLGLETTLGQITNYLPQNQSSFRLSYSYQFFKNASFITAYSIKSVVNQDPAVTSGSYQSHGLDFELRFNFSN